MAKPDYETILRVFRVFNGFRGPSHDGLWWRTDGEYAPVTLFVNCSDLFVWGCSDSEEVDSSNVHVLEQALADTLAISEKVAMFADILFCCRMRGARPQGAYYKHLPKELWPLLDACGPEREVDFANPVKQPSQEDTSCQDAPSTTK